MKTVRLNSAEERKSTIDMEYRVYSSRWLMLVIFCLLNMSNAVLWVTFAPITDVTSDYFDGASVTAVNMLALIFQISYAPGTLLGVIASKKYGLRNTLILGGILNTLGAFIRLVATMCRAQVGPWGAYTLMVLGQLIASLAQPIYVNLPATIAADWFAVDERDVATTIAALFNPLGAAIGQVLPPIFVTATDSGNVHGMFTLMLVEVFVCAVPLLLAVMYFESKPPTAPSRSAFIKDTAQQIDNLADVETYEDEIEEELSRRLSMASSQADPLLSAAGDKTEQKMLIGGGGGGSSTDPKSNGNGTGAAAAASSGLSREDIDFVKKEFDALMGNKDYVILLVAFSIGLGLFNAYLTLIYQLIEPHGYSNDDAGTFAAILIFMGLIGAGVTGVVLDTTHMYREVLRMGFVACGFALVLFSCMLYADNFVLLSVSFGILGLFMLPMLPAVVENCAECTYPIQEDLSVGLLFVGGNIVGIPFVIVLQELIRLPSWGPAPLLPSNLFLVALVIVATIILQFYNGEYKRLKCEKLKGKEGPEEHLLGNERGAGGGGAGFSSAYIDPQLARVSSNRDRTGSNYSGAGGGNSNVSTNPSTMHGSVVDPGFMRHSQSTNAGSSMQNYPAASSASLLESISPPVPPLAQQPKHK